MAAMTSLQSKFQLKVAVLGCESTGKSTVVNALCAAGCSEASWGRTTAGINTFRLFTMPSAKGNVATTSMVIDLNESDGTKRSAPDQTEQSNKRIRTVQSICAKIKENNKDGTITSEGSATFDVPVAELPITMRADNQFVIVEAPGLNKSKAESAQFRLHFEDQWDTLDAVIVVIDAQEKSDHADQEESLQFVFDLWKSKKQIPCFILCNKVRLIETPKIV